MLTLYAWEIGMSWHLHKEINYISNIILKISSLVSKLEISAAVCHIQE